MTNCLSGRRLRVCLLGAIASTAVAAMPAVAADRMVLCEDFIATWCGGCQSAAPVYSQFLNNYEGSVAFIQYHVGGDSFSTTWGEARYAYYPLVYIPRSYFDGVIKQENHSYTAIASSYSTRNAVPTDVTIALSGMQYSGQTYRITANVCLESGGQAKTVRLYMVEVLDYYGAYGAFSSPRNCFRQAANTADITLTPGQCETVTRSFTFDSTSWASQDNIRIIAWVQVPATSGPAQVYQAAEMTWPFTAGDCNENGIPDGDEIAADPTIDCNVNGLIDECELEGNDCNNNSILDECDVLFETSSDCNGNVVPDECELGDNDCNANYIPDDCDYESVLSPAGQPVDQDVCDGDTVAISVDAVGDSLSYQWYFNDSPIYDGGQYSGATDATLYVSGFDTSNEGDYHCAVTLDGCVVRDSTAAEVAIIVDPLITSIPNSTSSCEDGTISFEIQHDGYGQFDYTYVWRKDGEILDRQPNSRRLTLSNLAVDDDGFYTCEVINAQCGMSEMSDPIELSILGATFTQLPQSQCQPTDGTATFNMVAESSGTITGYRWQRWYGEPYNVWVNLVTQAGDVQPLVLDGGLSSDKYRGAVYVENACWSYTEPVYLQVGPPTADMDVDGDVDLTDMAMFTACFSLDSDVAVGCTCGDFDDSDSVININDWPGFAAEVTGP